MQRITGPVLIELAKGDSNTPVGVLLANYLGRLEPGKTPALLTLLYRNGFIISDQPETAEHTEGLRGQTPKFKLALLWFVGAGIGATLKEVRAALRRHFTESESSALEAIAWPELTADAGKDPESQRYTPPAKFTPGGASDTTALEAKLAEYRQGIQDQRAAQSAAKATAPIEVRPTAVTWDQSTPVVGQSKDISWDELTPMQKAAMDSDTQLMKRVYQESLAASSKADVPDGPAQFKAPIKSGHEELHRTFISQDVKFHGTAAENPVLKHVIGDATLDHSGLRALSAVYAYLIGHPDFDPKDLRGTQENWVEEVLASVTGGEPKAIMDSLLMHLDADKDLYKLYAAAYPAGLQALPRGLIAAMSEGVQTVIDQAPDNTVLVYHPQDRTNLNSSTPKQARDMLKATRFYCYGPKELEGTPFVPGFPIGSAIKIDESKAGKLTMPDTNGLAARPGERIIRVMLYYTEEIDKSVKKAKGLRFCIYTQGHLILNDWTMGTLNALIADKAKDAFIEGSAVTVAMGNARMAKARHETGHVAASLKGMSGDEHAMPVPNS